MSIASYEEVKDLPNHPEILLIDVREPDELQSTGVIPTSINIPLNELESALSEETSSEDFKEMYGHEKPAKNDPVILHCRSGTRSAKALDIACELGYTNTKNYQGSWNDWAAKNSVAK